MSRGPAPVPVEIPADLRPDLEALSCSTLAPHAVVQRAAIVLLSAEGMAAWAVADEIGCDERTVRKWKARFRASPKVTSLYDLDRTGRPARVELPVRCKVVQLACERPDGKFAPFRDVWTLKALADATLSATGVRLSVSEVGRILRFEKLRPHHVRQWLHSPDPAFQVKAEQVCDIYLNPPKGALVVCFDEKPVQVLGRKHPTHTGPDGEVRFEYEYIRRGTCSVLAAFDVGSGDVLVDVVPHRTAEATVAFLEMLAALHPDREIYVVWDNLNTHYDGKDRRWTLFNERQGGRFHFVYTPIHASWMNQVEVWFSILERRILKHGNHDDFEHVYAAITGFARYWNLVEGHPFRWTWRYQPAQNRTRLAAA